MRRCSNTRSSNVESNVKGVDFLFKKNKIEAFHGAGRIAAPGKVEVKADDGKTQTLETKNIVIATGSDVARLPGIDIDEKRIVSSTGALDLAKVPQKLLVVGAGIIGMELGSVWRRLGAEVTVVEFLDHILPGIDSEVARQFQRIQQKQGIAFKLSSKVTAVDTSGKLLKVKVEPAAGGAAETIEADVVLVAIGRVPYTEGLGLEADRRQKATIAAASSSIRISRTNVAGIYAIGDVIAGPMLAHKAEEEGVAVAEILAGQAGHVNYEVIPNVVYTSPEIASVGKTEEELKAAGVAYNAGKFPFTANARARANLATEGFVKILADAKTDRVLGVHILGPDAETMIAEAAIAMEFGASSEDIARTCHAHPTLSEAMKEAALAVAKRAINMYVIASNGLARSRVRDRLREAISLRGVLIALASLGKTHSRSHGRRHHHPGRAQPRLQPDAGDALPFLPLGLFDHHPRVARFFLRHPRLPRRADRGAADVLPRPGLSASGRQHPASATATTSPEATCSSAIIPTKAACRTSPTWRSWRRSSSGATLVGFAGSIAHKADVGGTNAGLDLGQRHRNFPGRPAAAAGENLFARRVQRRSGAPHPRQQPPAGPGARRHACADGGDADGRRPHPANLRAVRRGRR